MTYIRQVSLMDAYRDKKRDFLDKDITFVSSLYITQTKDKYGFTNDEKLI